MRPAFTLRRDSPPPVAGALLTAIWIASLCAGCAAAAPSTSPATQGATTRPATTQAAATDVLKMTDAIPVEAFEGPDTQVSLVSKFSSPQAGVPMYFGTASNSEQDSGIALIVETLGDQMLAIPIDNPLLSNPQWMYAGAGPALGELWGILDGAGDSPAADVVIAHSTDGGATWRFSAIHKPVDQADFSEFVMSRDGHGRLSLYLGSDCVDPTMIEQPAKGNKKPRRKPKRDPVRAGAYHYRTSDGGKTWVMQFEPDQLTPGADVPDEDQPQSKMLVKLKN